MSKLTGQFAKRLNTTRLIVVALLFGFSLISYFDRTIMSIAGPRMTANWIPVGYHARVQGLIIAGSSAGAAISPLLFTWMLLHIRWRVSFIAAACATAALSIFWLWYARDHPPGVSTPRDSKTEQERASWTKLFANRNLMLLYLCIWDSWVLSIHLLLLDLLLFRRGTAHGRASQCAIHDHSLSG